MAGLEKLIGEVLDGKYRLEKLLGQGGMGAVYLATHLGTERAVALKLIAPQFMRNDEFVERFKREARAAGRLRHPNVVDVTDFGFSETDGERVAYLVMEYLDGCTLADVLAEEKRLPLDWVVEILEQACSAVDEAHQQGIVHRDLKPDNIWLEPTRLGGYRVKVLDFGIAKLGEAGFDEETEPPRPEVDPLPAPASVDGGQSSLEALRASIERAAASLRPDSERRADSHQPPEAATQLYTPGVVEPSPAAPALAADVEAATQLYAPPARDARDEERGTLILGPAEDGAGEDGRAAPAEADGPVAARPTVLEPSRAQTVTEDDAAPRLTRQAEDADRTRMLDAPPQGPSAQDPAAQSAGRTRSDSAALTRVGSIMGTPLYMSPEQCRGRRLDARSDIYSLGVIAYQMLAGETPFTGDMASVMRQHVEVAPPDLRGHNRKVPRRAARVVMGALSKTQELRPPTAAAFASSLRANSAGTGTLLRRAFALYSEHFPTFLRLTLFAHIPVLVTTALLFSLEVADARGALGRVAGPAAILLVSLLHAVASFVSNSAISGVTAVIVTQLQLAPLRPVSLRAAVAVLRRRWRPFLRTSISVTLRIFFGFCLFLIPGLWMMVKYTLYAPVVLLEGLSKKAARARANELSRRSRRSVIALMLVNMALPLVIGAVVGGLSVGAGGRGVNVSSKSDPDGVQVSTSTNRSGVRITTTDDEADTAGGNAPGGAASRSRQQVNLAQKAVSHAISLLSIFITPLVSITTALLYLKLRQMGGETMRDTLAQFEEVEPPRSRWQRRMRDRLTARTPQGRSRTSQTQQD